jgi:hypothetical protein
VGSDSFGAVADTTCLLETTGTLLCGGGMLAPTTVSHRGDAINESPSARGAVLSPGLDDPDGSP